jgi:hypothetical protein
VPEIQSAEGATVRPEGPAFNSHGRKNLCKNTKSKR